MILALAAMLTGAALAIPGPAALAKTPGQPVRLSPLPVPDTNFETITTLATVASTFEVKALGKRAAVLGSTAPFQSS